MWERGWGGGGKSDEDVYEVIIMDESLRKSLLPDIGDPINGIRSYNGMILEGPVA